MDFNQRWRRELRFNVIMLGLSSLACVLTALSRSTHNLPDETPVRISQHLLTAQTASVAHFNQPLTN